MGGIVCLMVCGAGFTDELRDALYEAAQALLAGHRKNKKRRIKGSTFEGLVTTQHRYSMVGQFGGFIFEAEVDVAGEEAPTRTRFLAERCPSDLTEWQEVPYGFIRDAEISAQN